MKKYDIAIIGGGPAGYTASLYAGRAGLSSAVIEKLSPGGQMAITSDIENYPGFEHIGGFELAEKMTACAERFGGETVYAEVKEVSLFGHPKKIITDDGEIEASAVVIATGAKPRYLEVAGEVEYTGRGVSYCASCDGFFFRGKTVCVSGGGDTAFEDVMYLSNICKKVYLIHRRDEFRASAVAVERARKKENVEFILSTTITEIKGDGNLVCAVEVTDKKSGEKRELACDGVFVAVGRIPDTSVFEGQLDMENGYIKADETCRTSVPGVYAAGDVRTKPLRQIVTACADGAVAVKFAEEYIESLE